MESVDIMKLRMVIYMALNTVNGKVYIGKTVQSLKRRMYAHLFNSRRGDNSHFYNGIRKHGWEAFEWSVLDDTCKSCEELCDRERYYIELYQSFTLGYNGTLGGDGLCGLVHKEESKRKMSDAMLGSKNPNYGKVTPDHVKDKMRQAMKEYFASDAYQSVRDNSRLQGADNPRSKRYLITDGSGLSFVIVGLGDFCKKNGLNAGCMRMVACGKRKQHKGFKCERIEDIPIPPPVPVYDYTAPLMEVFFGA